MKTSALTLASTLGMTSAFVTPSTNGGRVVSSALRMSSVEDLPGVSAEIEGVWDPAGFSKKGENSLYRYRCAELKHGRVAQLAVLGVWAQNFFHFNDPAFSETAPLKEFSKLVAERPIALWQIFIAVGAAELTVFKQDPNEAPGDVGFGAAFKPEDPAAFEDLQIKELKHCRLAMLAIIGMFVQENISGLNPFEQLHTF